MNNTLINEVDVYACPECHSRLCLENNALCCRQCSIAYRIIQGIPEFITEELSKSADPELRRMRYIDKIARIYETDLWYSVVMKLYGGFHSPLLKQLRGMVSDMLHTVEGQALDVACGPGTFGRRAASQFRKIWGIDVSRGMLRQAAAYTASENIPNMHFARARVEALPFGGDCFDAVICCGSLHLFTDTVAALREISRVTKPGAPLAVFTFTSGNGGILKRRRLREYFSQKYGLHVFTLPEMEQYLAASGFDQFRPKVYGSVLTFSARKA